MNQTADTTKDREDTELQKDCYLEYAQASNKMTCSENESIFATFGHQTTIHTHKDTLDIRCNRKMMVSYGFFQKSSESLEAGTGTCAEGMTSNIIALVILVRAITVRVR